MFVFPFCEEEARQEDVVLIGCWCARRKCERACVVRPRRLSILHKPSVNLEHECPAKMKTVLCRELSEGVDFDFDFLGVKEAARLSTYWGVGGGELREL